MYDKLSGMTGTAQTEAARLNSIYKLGVIPIPTNMPMIRMDQKDLIYHRGGQVRRRRRTSSSSARSAIVSSATSVEKSEYLSQQLKKQGIKHEVLNAKQHELRSRDRRRGRPESAP